MAKLLRHLGIGAKKAPPQPPKPDYTAIKPTTSESALSKSPTSDRSGTSHIGEFELAQLPGSPHHRVSGPSEKGGFGGARPKDSGGGGVSPKSASGDRASISIDEPETAGPEKPPNEGTGGGQGASATPPRLLDEYSDPADLKKETPEELLGACANPLVEDDYSVPYEVKSMFRDLQLRGGEGLPEGDVLKKAKGPRLYDDPYEEPVAGQAPPIIRPFPPPFPLPETTDKRPKEDYDEPWEWSAKQSRLLQSQLEASGHNIIPPHFISVPSATQGLTPQLKRTGSGPTSSSPAGSSRDGESPAPDESDGGAGSPTTAATPAASTDVGAAEAGAAASVAASAGAEEAHHEGGEAEDVYEIASGYELTERTKAEDSDEDSYEHLREELEGEDDDDDDEDDDPETGTARTGNYEEPWDLTSKQVELENKIKEASDRASREKIAVAKSSGPAPHESDTRSQEGYEKPWDWKPHLKDDRPQEGYEKPWDWKPHQKDDRPTEEYEEPWDQKAKELERDLMLNKGSTPDTTSPTGSAAPPASSTPPPVKDNKEDDTRPPAEYDEPWDNKKKAPVSRTGSSADSSPKSSPSAAAAAALQASLSPKKKHKLNLDLGSRAWNTLGERVDPNLPLNQQGWYHGSISRVDAENLLRVHKEGSYLVRMSESNKMDYSLSLKSTRGFMHMKIVSRDKRFILGQFSQPFDTIPQMIHHYSISKLPIKGAEHMSLLHPIMNELL